ncbi:MAG: lysophospholipid acyltransferase family protein [Candidatus Omnitrophota bacterium]
MFAYLLYRFGIAIAVLVPVRIAYKIAVLCADIKYLVSKRERHWMLKNLSIALPQADKRAIKKLSREIFRNFTKYLADFFRFSKIDAEYIKEHVKVEGLRHIDAALAKGKGAVILSAHIGNWELGGVTLGILGYPIHAVALDHKSRRVNDFFRSQRERHNEKVFSINFSLRPCLRCLKNNGLLALVGDKDYTNTGIVVDFFGKKAMIPKGPAFFHLKTGTPIISGVTLRDKDDYFRLVFGAPIEYEATGDFDRDIARLTEKCVRTIEPIIQKYPEQWYCFRQIHLE